MVSTDAHRDDKGRDSAMIVTQRLIDVVKKFEGFTPTALWDYKQYTNGYGTRAQTPTETITVAVAEIRLRRELGLAADRVETFAPNAPLGVKQALTDLTFNEGTTWTGAGLGECVLKGDWSGASERLLMYNRAGGEFKQALYSRRRAEASWFVNPLVDKAQPPKPTPAPTEPQMFNPTILVQILSMLPQLVQAVEAILASDGAHTIESAVKVLLDHNTKGQPNAPALAPKT